MEIKIILFINLLAYSFIVSQSFSYIIALTNVQKSMDAVHYIELRHLLDRNFRKKYSIVVYSTLISSTLLVIFCSLDIHYILFTSSVIAWICFAADVILTLKGNMPINNIINTWTKDNYPVDWQQYRAKWLYIFRMRQVVTIIGFTCLLAGIIFSL